MFAEDLSTFFHAAELADNATLGGADVVGIFNTAAEVAADDGSIIVAPSFRLPASAAAGANGQAFVHAGVAYTVLNTLREPPDGAIARLVLRRD